eukprot:8647859-Pyramimonas_sp.AAC.1
MQGWVELRCVPNTAPTPKAPEYARAREPGPPFPEENRQGRKYELHGLRAGRLKTWLSPQRREHVFQILARTSRIEGGSISKCGSRLNAAHIRSENCAAVTLIRGAEVPGMAFGHVSGSSRRNSQIDLWRWNPENDSL